MTLTPYLYAWLHQVESDRRMTPYCFRIAWKLAGIYDGHPFIGLRELSDTLDLHRRQMQRAIVTLEHCGHVERKKRKGQAEVELHIKLKGVEDAEETPVLQTKPDPRTFSRARA